MKGSKLAASPFVSWLHFSSEDGSLSDNVFQRRGFLFFLTLNLPCFIILEYFQASPNCRALPKPWGDVFLIDPIKLSSLRGGAMKVMCAPKLRGFSHLLLLIFLFSCAMLQAQQKTIIKEKIEIAPKIRTSTKIGPDSSHVPFFDYRGTTPNGCVQAVGVCKPCYVTGTSTLESNEGVPIIVLLGRGNSQLNITNSSGTVPIGCDDNSCGVWAQVEVYCYVSFMTGIEMDSVSITVGDQSATMSFKGLLWYWYTQRSIPFSVTVSLHADPISVPSHFEMTPQFVSLDATEGGSFRDDIGLIVIDNLSNWYRYCCHSSPIRFTLETEPDVKLDSIPGLTLVDREYGNVLSEGDTIYVSYPTVYCPTCCGAELIWDGSVLPKDSVVVKVVADGMDLSDSVRISLIKIHPDHFDIETEPGQVEAGQSVVIRAIGKTKDGKEESFDGQTKVTFYSPEGGYFIVGADTLIDTATVAYSVARSGGVKFLDYYGILWSGTEPYDTPLEVWRTDQPNRKGQGTLTTLPLCEVLFVQNTVRVGDTVQIGIMMKNANGDLVSYAPDEPFDIWMNTDESYGTLRSSSGDSGSSICGTQPFLFIAADSIDEDSVIVQIEAWPTWGCGGGGGNASIVSPANETLSSHAGLMLKMKRDEIAKKSSPQRNRGEMRAAKLLDRELKKRLSRLKEEAKRRPHLNKLLAKLESRYANAGNAAANSGVRVAQKISAKVAQTASTCQDPEDEVTVKKEEPELVVITLPDDKKDFFIAGTNLPKMPNPIIKAQLKNFR
jgi:hypothetical protein